MTKFEEELFNKVPCKFELTTEAEYKKTTLINHFKNWHSDDEYQELFDKYSNLNDNYEKEVIRSSKLESQIADLKSQLQQQSLPVVPECVAEWYEEHKNDLESSIYRLCIEFNQKVVNTLKTKTKLENWLDYTENKPMETLIRMQDGYIVEKPQLFYLKNKMTGAYLYYDEATNYYYDSDIVGYLEIYYEAKAKFTQQEIGSMDAGSYEQIPVPVEDGE